MTIAIKLLGATDGAVLANVAPDLFDETVDPALTAAFLRESNHRIVVALDHDLVVGFASGVIYVHPDKPHELWINEVSVAADYHRRGLATQILQALFAAGRAAGCQEAWVLTERSNTPAMRLYQSLGGEEPIPDVVYLTFALGEER